MIHHPVCNKFGDVITTSITNLDIHDIARSAITFGIKKFFIVTPLSSQKNMLMRIIDFWNTEAANKFNPARKKALELVQHQFSFQETVDFVIKQECCDPVIVGTTAKDRKGQISYPDLRKIICEKNQPLLIVLGTGNGLAQDLLSRCDLILKPVYGAGNYNHLSVRSAAAIILDRLTSEK